MTENRCLLCDDTGWVCEDHGDRPLKGDSSRDDACDCRVGVPCPMCNRCGGIDDSPRPPPGFTITQDARKA